MSSQTVYFTNPSTISTLQSDVSTLQSQANLISQTGSFTAVSNRTYNIMLPFLNASQTGTFTITFPAAPVSGDFITLIDGNGNWGNIQYQTCRVSFNGKTSVGACSNGLLFDYRKGNVTFIYDGTKWNGSSINNLSSLTTLNNKNVDDLFTGWYSTVTKGLTAISSLYPAVNSSSTLVFQWQYMYIDATRYPVQIVLYPGSPQTVTDYSTTTVTSFEIPSNDPYSLVHINSPLGTNPLPLSWFNQATPGACMKLQTGAGKLGTDYLLMTQYCSTGVVGFGDEMYVDRPMLWKRIPATEIKNGKPSLGNKILAATDEFEFNQKNFEDPVVMTRTWLENLTYNTHQCLMSGPLTATGAMRINTDYISIDNGASAIEDLWQQLISPAGITHTTPIINVVRSFSGAAGNLVSVGSTELTDIYTGECSFVNPGARVTISGFTGGWEGLNGNYLNGVSAYECSCVSYISPWSMDYLKLSTGSFTGSFVNAFNRFLLNADTWNYPAQTTGVNAGWGIYTGTSGLPTVSVNYRVYSTMPLNEYFAVCAYIGERIGGVNTHFRLNTQRNANIIQNRKLGLLTPRYDLQDCTSIGLRIGATNSIADFNGGVPSTLGLRRGNSNVNYAWTYRNDPYQCELQAYNQIYGSTSTFAQSIRPIVLNYFTGSAYNIYWGFDGTGTNGPIETDPIYSQIKNMTNTQYKTLRNITYTGTIGGSRIVGKIFPLQVGTITLATGSGGPSQSDLPDTRYWATTNQQSATADSQGNNISLFFGQIDPKYTSGKRIAYIRQYILGIQGMVDVQMLSYMNIFGSNNLATGSLKPFRQAVTDVYSKMFEYISSPSGVNAEHIIWDIRGISGGNSEDIPLLEFVGGDRSFAKQYWVRKDQGTSKVLYDFTDKTKFTTTNEFLSTKNSYQAIFTRDNAVNYPNAMFRGTSTGPKKIVLLVDPAVSSAGQLSAHNFSGDNTTTKNLGNFVTCKILGSMDTRFPGGSMGQSTLEVPPNIANSTRLGAWPLIQAQSASVHSGLMLHNPPTSTGPYVWIHADSQSFTVDAPSTGTFRGVNNCLPVDFQSTIYYDWGVIPAPSGRYINQSDPSWVAPTLSNYQTWKDIQLETAILEAIYP